MLLIFLHIILPVQLLEERFYNICCKIKFFFTISGSGPKSVVPDIEGHSSLLYIKVHILYFPVPIQDLLAFKRLAVLVFG